MREIFTFFAIAVLGVAFLTACNSAEKKIASTLPTSGASPAAKAPADGIRRITVVELQDLLTRNAAVVIDVRNEDAYKSAHIRGAKLIPVGETLSHISELPKDKLIVTYCA